MKEQIIQLAKDNGFSEILPQNNPHMVSFWSEIDYQHSFRVNVYYTTMTVTVQYNNGEKMEIYKNVSLEKFEDILNSI